jgi:hypothetical protein
MMGKMMGWQNDGIMKGKENDGQQSSIHMIFAGWIF